MIGPLHPPGIPMIQGIHVYIKPTALLDTSGALMIGNQVDISDGVYIYTHHHALRKANWRYLPVEPVSLVIEDNVFIGTGAIILAGVGRIGKSAVIGAGSVVTKEVPAMEIWAGNPAKKIGDVEP